MKEVTSELTDFLDKANMLIRQSNEQGIELTPEIARDNMRKLAYFSGDKEPVVAITDHTLPLADRDIPVRIYQPDLDRKLPVLIYFHGGGHMCGSIEVYDSIARQLANSTSHIVMSVEYRLAPEFPYPGGLEDCLTSVELYKSLLTNIPYQRDQLAICGDSAGGALAVTVANQIPQLINKLVLIYPSLDYTFSTDSYRQLAQGYLLETNRIQWYFDHYFKDNDTPKKASPLFFADLQSLPPSLIIAAGLDPLVDEGKLFHQKLTALGVASQYHVEPDLIHAFFNLAALIPDRIQKIHQRISNFLNNPLSD